MGGCAFLSLLLEGKDATKLFVAVFVTTFATAYANKLVKGNNKRKKTTPTSAKRRKGGSKNK